MKDSLSLFKTLRNCGEKWSPTGKARGASMKIPSYAKASEGYPPVAKSAEAAQHIDIECFGHDLRIHPRAKPVIFCVGG
jgi:hypothetical protein